MALRPGDITELHGMETMLQGEDKLLHTAIQYAFKVRGQGPFKVNVWREGFTAKKATDAVTKFAEEYVAVLEAV